MSDWQKVPRRIWLRNQPIKIDVVAPDHPVLAECDARGHTLFDNSGGTTILISNALGISAFLEVVIHEITHVINFLWDIDDGAEEEAMATAHGEAWAMLLVANPAYQRWLTRTVNMLRKEQK